MARVRVGALPDRAFNRVPKRMSLLGLELDRSRVRLWGWGRVRQGLGRRWNVWRRRNVWRLWSVGRRRGAAAGALFAIALALLRGTLARRP